MSKNSFVLRMSYGDIIEEMSDKQAGTLIKAIFNYVATGDEPAGFNDVELKMAFRFIKKDIDYDAEKYKDTCAKRAISGSKGGKQKVANATNCSKSSKTYHDDVVVDVDVVVDSDKQQLLTADCAAGAPRTGGGATTAGGKRTTVQVQKPQKELNNLQKFSNAVIAEFEELETDEQIGVWFKRNCRCLSDILKFCGGNQELGIETIRVCAERLKAAGLTGGYEAVCRNLPEYYGEAKKRLEAQGGTYED